MAPAPTSSSRRLHTPAKANTTLRAGSHPYRRKSTLPGSACEYDPESGFTPVPPEEYSAWFRAVAANIAAVLAPDGSSFLNIKAHADDGERNLYVMDLVLAHKRQWGWRFVDEFAWVKTNQGCPGGWPNRFKCAWEGVY